MTSDAKDTQTDAPKPSDEKTPEPSTPPKTYKQEEVDKLLSERHSTLDKEIAGLKKTIASNTKGSEGMKARLKAAEETATQLRAAAERAEFDAIPRDNPDALSLFTARQAHREDVRTHEANVATFEEQKAEFEADIAAVKEYKKLQAAVEIVSRDEFKGVKAKDLVDYTDGSPDKMENLAKVLKLTVGEIPPSQPPEIPPDTGGGQGSAGQLTTEQADKMSMEDYASHPRNVERMNARD